MKGSCLCSGVQFEITPPFKGFQYCFCSRCRKLSGSAHGANIFVPADQLCWVQGQDKVMFFKLPDAKRFSSCFCTTYGSPLPWRIPDSNHCVVPAGALDEYPVLPGVLLREYALREMVSNHHTVGRIRQRQYAGCHIIQLPNQAASSSNSLLSLWI